MVNFKIDSGAEVVVVPSSFAGIIMTLQSPVGQLMDPAYDELKGIGTLVATLSWRG